MRDAVIVSAARTAIAKENGSLRDVPPEDFAAVVIKEAISRAGLDAMEIDEIIFGHCLGAVGAMARVASLVAGLPMSIPALTLDRQCCSGLEAVNRAAMAVMAGQADVVVAGGVESMTRQPYLMQKPTSAYQRSAPAFLSRRRLSPDSIGDPPMGVTAENVAQQYQVSREDQDAFAFESQAKAAAAIREGRFKEQIVPVVIPQKKGEPLVFDTDEHPRETSLEKLAKLSPVFRQGGSVTAGNASGINDGAGAVVVMERSLAEKKGLKPFARVVGFAAAGVDPNIMGMGPVPAVRKVLERTGMSINDIDVFELNEAFASQALACARELGIDLSKVNPNGGAIALGHPIAGSLAILTVKMVYELQRQQARYGLITACAGGGQGVATILERL